MDDSGINTSSDEQLLRHFFSEQQLPTIADNGFSERVAKRLPRRVNWFGRLWTASCIMVFAVWFVSCRGWALLAAHFDGLLHAFLAGSFDIHPFMLASVLFGLLFVGVGEAVSRA